MDINLERKIFDDIAPVLLPSYAIPSPNALDVTEFFTNQTNEEHYDCFTDLIMLSPDGSVSVNRHGGMRTCWHQ